jgi:hypothetical protein
MITVIERRMIERQGFLDHFRRVYLTAVCRERGAILNLDLRRAALMGGTGDDCPGGVYAT